VCVAALLLACGGDEKTIETESGTFTVESEGGGLRFSGQEEGVGEVSGHFGEDAEIPADFPSDLPVYPGAKVVAGVVAGKGGMVTLQTGDDPGEVADFYREKLAGEGWSLGSEMNLGGQRILPVEKEGRNAVVQISGDGSETTILITTDQGG
jgi:hypothetical protein